ncbi:MULTISPECIES: TrkA family potassium uptake protein [unclassified Granulicatella]|uniref:potassium channel family protein n=1 Tax=unclassified Granulicatella TaxID=2630493 RepID=UPI0010744CED|nr:MULTISPECIES: TrkA family potassium uptake protein [unclassified Granulicatella]MBF0780688.1 TrkA family potassium uptake protein [Granulicatella sp. 19428wC4_WM01]TFU94230.1 TrkA family potassium uptake protein [Granulicatella sp. WM01]
MKLNINNVAVLGLGIFGETVARQLAEQGCDVIVVDQNEKCVDAIVDDVVKAVVGDFTDVDLLESIGVGECDAVIVATGTKLESAVLAVMSVKKLNVPYIIAKAQSEIVETVLYTLGVDMVITPEKDAGKQLVKLLKPKKIEEMLRLDEQTSIIEFNVPEKWVGKTIRELDLRHKHGLNLLGIKYDRSDHLQANLSIDVPLTEDLIIVAVNYSNTFIV